MDNYEIKNAKIQSTDLGPVSHGCMQFWINLDYGSSGQGFGGFILDNYDESKDKRVGTAYGLMAIMEVLRVVGVDKWEDLVGKSVRAEANMNNVKRLGHFLKDEWLDLKELADEFKDEPK